MKDINWKWVGEWSVTTNKILLPITGSIIIILVGRFLAYFGGEGKHKIISQLLEIWCGLTCKYAHKLGERHKREVGTQYT